MTEVFSRVKMVFLALVVALVAASVGFYMGQSQNAAAPERSISTDLLTHRDRGKSCEAHGKYGNLKPPRASHCEGEPGH